MSKITNVITLAEYANKHELDAKRLRRLARKNEFPGEHVPFKFGSIWAIDATAPAITLPDKSERGQRRPDGRQRFIVFGDVHEMDAVKNIVGNDNVIDPRIVSRERRNARKLADALTEMGDNAIIDDPPHPDDITRAAELNAAELADIERGIDTLENDVNG